MRGTARRWGSGAAVRLPAAVMRAARLEPDAPVELREEDGRVVIEPVRESEVALADLRAGVTGENRHEGVDAAVLRRATRLSRAWPASPMRETSSGCRSTRGAARGRSGRGRAGHRPALVLSPASYDRTGLMPCRPMATRVKGYPFEVPIAPARPADPPSVVPSDQAKSLDWRARRARRKGRVKKTELAMVQSRAMALIRRS